MSARGWVSQSGGPAFAAGPSHHIWAYDFVADRTHAGRPLKILTGVDPLVVTGLVGVIVVAFALLGQVNFDWRITAPRDGLLQPLVGLSAGLIGGISSIFAPPIIMYLVSLKLPKDEYVGTVGLAYFVGVMPMALALAAFGRFGGGEALWGAAALIPVLAGMVIGERLRGRVSETTFRRFIFGSNPWPGLRVRRPGRPGPV